MNKSDLTDEISMRMALHPKTAEAIVNSILNSIVKAMEEKIRVEIRGFGSFDVRRYNPYMGRNPRSGQRVPVGAKELPFFKAGKELRERVNSRK